jgi:hypothetical protein
MAMSTEEQQKGTPTPKKKPPYRKPAFRYESVFETSALRCGKVQSTQAPCHSSRNAS